MKKKLLCALLVVGLVLTAAMAVIMQPLLPMQADSDAPHVDPKLLETHVRALSERFHPRSYDQPENLEAAVAYLREHFSLAGGRVSLQPFQVEERVYNNIVAAFGPDDGPTIIVGAHYDAYCENYREPEMYTPGADDNASGVAGLLALASLFSERPPAKRVLLVAYCLEEPPHFGTRDMGSAVHAASVSRGGMDVIGMLSLEMIGFFSDAPGSQTYPIGLLEKIYPTTGDFIGVVGRFQDIPLTRTVKAAMAGATDLPVWSMSALPLVQGIDFSDHRNYWRFGYQAVMITDTAYFRNPAYHTLRDTADSLDYVRMSKVVQGVYRAICALAGSQ